MDDSVILRIAHLDVRFRAFGRGLLWRPRLLVRAVDDVSLVIHKGETLGLVGESGSGKTTLGRALLQLYRPSGGSVEYEGIDLTKLDALRMRRMRRKIQMIFQDPYGSLDPRMSVGRIIGEPMAIHGGASRPQQRTRVEHLLREVGLEASAVDRFPHQFSGGQRQRIGIARALAVEPAFIVCDEPVSALDVSIQAQIINLLKDLQHQHDLTYLFIGHDLAVVRNIATRVAVMYLGRLVEVAGSADLYRHPFHPYTRALLSAVPTPDPVAERRRQRIILTGEPPSPADPPPGCHFHPRCWLRERMGSPERCQVETPELRVIEPGRLAACHYAEEM